MMRVVVVVVDEVDRKKVILFGGKVIGIIFWVLLWIKCGFFGSLYVGGCNCLEIREWFLRMRMRGVV